MILDCIHEFIKDLRVSHEWNCISSNFVLHLAHPPKSCVPPIQSLVGLASCDANAPQRALEGWEKVFGRKYAQAGIDVGEDRILGDACYLKYNPWLVTSTENWELVLTLEVFELHWAKCQVSNYCPTHGYYCANNAKADCDLRVLGNCMS